MGRRKALNEIFPRFPPSPSRPTPPPPLPPALHPTSPKRSPLSPVPGGDLRVCVLCHSSRGRWHVSTAGPPLGRQAEEICIGFIYHVFDEYRLLHYGGLFVSFSQAQNLIVSLVPIANVSLFPVCFCDSLREEDKNIFDYCRENNIEHVSQAISSQKVDVNIKDEEVFATHIH